MQILTSVVAAPQPRSPNVSVSEVQAQSDTQKSQRTFVLTVVLIVVAIAAVIAFKNYVLPKILQWYEEMPPLAVWEVDTPKGPKPQIFPKLVDIAEGSPVSSPALVPKPRAVPYVSMATYAAQQVERKTLSAVAGTVTQLTALEVQYTAPSVPLEAVTSAVSAATAASTAQTIALTVGSILLQTLLLVL